MEKFNIFNWKTGEIIFSHTCEDNTYKKTVEEAVKQGVSLAYASLSFLNLKGINLAYMCLENAKLNYTSLKDADLSYSSLKGAYLCDADLSYSNLSYADLSNAILNDSYSRMAYFIGANMRGSIIHDAVLYESNFSNADLSYADLTKSDLYSCNLTNANLSNCNLHNANLNMALTNSENLNNALGLNDQCPKEGSFIGWKKCIGYDSNYIGYDSNCYIVKLEILEDAKRSSSTGIKCRCSKAKVLEIQNLDGTKADIDEVQSWHDLSFKYRIGEIVEVPDFDERYWLECAPGIHFFMYREDAINY